jgi:3-hydroxyisobutyrate dehydrogenase
MSASPIHCSQHVREVYLGKDGLFGSTDSGTLFIDSSTTEPHTSIEMSKEAEKLGVTFMDAPVSGGVGAATAGTLTFIVGGSKSGFDRAKPLLDLMGKNVVHCGENGAGQATKICNNMMLGISMIGTSEALNLGIKLGLDPKVLSNVLNMSSGRSWSSDTYNPCPGVIEGVPSSRDYEGGFGTALMAKDLGLAQDAATTTKSPTPLGSLAHQIYRLMCAKGLSGKDFSVIFKYLQENSNN